MAWTIEIYCDEQGNSNVKEFLDSIEDKKLKAKVLRDIHDCWENLAPHSESRMPVISETESGSCAPNSPAILQECCILLFRITKSFC